MKLNDKTYRLETAICFTPGYYKKEYMSQQRRRPQAMQVCEYACPIAQNGLQWLKMTQNIPKLSKVAQHVNKWPQLA